MSCLAGTACAAAAAELLGAGLQAAGVGIPVGEAGAKLVDGMRNCGLPVPPKSWFKRASGSPSTGDSSGAARSDRDEGNGAPSGTIYDRLEAHVNGVMQVAKPVIELKRMLRENCGGQRASSRSADRSDRSPKSPKDKSLYYTPQKPSSNIRSDLNAQKFSTPKDDEKDREMPSMNYGWVLDENHHGSKRDESCMYCSRSSPLVELPCGRLICSKCDSTGDHELECKQCKKLIRD